MYRKILVPVDLAHEAALAKSLDVAAELARHYDAALHYVGVTAETPGKLAHSPKEYADVLDAFTARQVEAHGLSADSAAYAAHDPAIELNRTLMTAITDAAADLVVMASHIPNLGDHLWSSHGAHIARHAPVSVMLVR